MSMWLAIILALVTVALFRFVFKQSWVVSAVMALLVFLTLKIELIKPALNVVGDALGTNGVLGLAAVLMLVFLFMKIPVFISVLAAALLYFLLC